MFHEFTPRPAIWPRILTAAAIAIVVAGLFYPAMMIERSDGPRTPAKTGVVNLVAALKAYHTEYDKWPDFTGHGLFLDEQRQAQLLRVLCAKDETNNPRKIIFFEGKTATKRSGKYCGGFHPETGAFLDTWGNPYRIAIDADGDNQITDPYSSKSGTEIQTRVIAWSLGKDGQQGAPANPRTLKGSDNVVSWQ